MGGRTKQTVITALVVVVLILGGIITLVVVRQDRLIYFPRAYSAAELAAAPEIETLEFVTDQGRQTAFLLPARAQSWELPERLWVVFSGNASLALHWLDFARGFPDGRTAFLLVDYPGYGRCDGHPSPEAIQRSSEAALDLALKHASLQSDDLRVGLLGHSLGAAAALQLASRREVEHVVLLAPFTSMMEMARRTVGGVLARFLRHHFDNRARLTEILKRFPATRVTVVHGAQDEIIPVAMGRELAASSPERIEYLELPGADHNALAGSCDQELYRAMRSHGQQQPFRLR